MSAASGGARAELVAHLRAQAVDGGCFVNDFEGALLTPPERKFRLGIFDNATSAVTACPTGCAGDSDPATIEGRTLDACSIDAGCDLWNFADTELTKVVPNASGAYFYFGLFDEDAPDADDLLGDHWVFATGTISATLANDNDAPYKPGAATTPITSMCSRPVANQGAVGNFNATLFIFFSDTTAPSAPGSPAATDDAIPSVVWDNDTTLGFQWTLASDVNSGIDGYFVDLLDNGISVVTNQAIPSGGSVSVCTSCAVAVSVQSGRTYSLRVTARNGAFPDLLSQATASTLFVPVSVDLVNPVTSITSPATGTWLGATTNVAISDSDALSGLQGCEKRVASAGVETVAFSARSCNANYSLTVGPSAACRDEGVSSCQLTVRSTDQARRSSGNVSRLFNIDFTPDPIAVLRGFTGPGGPEIASGVLQLDNTPLLVWEAPNSTAPVVGFSTAVGSTPDCGVDLAEKSQNIGPLPAGSTTFGVRAIDQAGNCGPTATFVIAVESTPVPLLNRIGWGLLAGCLVAVGARLARTGPASARPI
jgi:hypothetical protein